jgi:anti-sigma-K factor RskA
MSRDLPPRDEMDRLAAEHVLGLLEGEEAELAVRRLASEPAFADAVEGWRRRFLELDLVTPPAVPTPELWARIEAGLARAERPAARPVDPTPVVVPDPRNAFRALWHSLAFWRYAGIASALAALLLALGLGFFADRAARTPVLVAVLLTETGNRPAAVVNAFADGRAELVPLESIPVPPGRALEIWTLWDRARGPVSIGLIDQARTVRLDLRNLPRGPNQLFEITLEPASGSPTGRPTGPILMKGLSATTL